MTGPQGGHAPPSNLYVYTPARPQTEEGVRRAVDEALSAQPSPWASHPSPGQRFEWAARVGGPRHAAAGDEDDAWALFADRRTIETAMTDRLICRV